MLLCGLGLSNLFVFLLLSAEQTFAQILLLRELLVGLKLVLSSLLLPVHPHHALAALLEPPLGLTVVLGLHFLAGFRLLRTVALVLRSLLGDHLDQFLLVDVAEDPGGYAGSLLALCGFVLRDFALLQVPVRALRTFWAVVLGSVAGLLRVGFLAAFALGLGDFVQLSLAVDGALGVRAVFLGVSFGGGGMLPFGGSLYPMNLLCFLVVLTSICWMRGSFFGGLARGSAWPEPVLAVAMRFWW